MSTEKSLSETINLVTSHLHPEESNALVITSAEVLRCLMSMGLVESRLLLEVEVRPGLWLVGCNSETLLYMLWLTKR